MIFKEQRIRKKAGEWLVEKDDGLSEEQELELNQWLQADERHARIYAELEESWIRMHQLRRAIALADAEPDADVLMGEPVMHKQPMKRVFVKYGSFAAALLIGFVFIIWQVSEPSVVYQQETHITGFNDFKRIILPDETILELNQNTEALVYYDEAVRRVLLTRGEAHFQVIKDFERPFLVDVGEVNVVALGTAFNVKYVDDYVEVLVTEGKVAVTQNQDMGQAEMPEAIDGPHLTAGDQAIIGMDESVDALELKRLNSAEYEQVLAWKGPRFFFENTPLYEAIAEFNHHNELKIIIEDEEIRNLSIGGSFLLEDVEAFIRLLSTDSEISIYRKDASTIYLRKTE